MNKKENKKSLENIIVPEEMRLSLIVNGNKKTEFSIYNHELSANFNRVATNKFDTTPRRVIIVAGKDVALWSFHTFFKLQALSFIPPLTMSE